MFRISSLRVLWGLSVVLVAVLSLLPKAAPVVDFPQSDKVAHCLAYAWLACLAASAWSGRAASVRVWAVLALGIGLEFAQAFVPGRFFSLLDIGANALGVVLGWWLGMRMADRLHRLLGR